VSDDGTTQAAGTPGYSLRSTIVLGWDGAGAPGGAAEARARRAGGGIDVLLSARRVGLSGFAYGVDMTDDMLDLARQNAAKAANATDVEFRNGEMEALHSAIIRAVKPG